MKKIFLLLSLAFLSCHAQQQTIVPLKNTHWEYPDGSYLKDTDGFLDNFVGTWKYQNGNEQLIFVVKKEIKHFFNPDYEDILYGEYKYINADGELLVNTLDMIDYPYSSMLYHEIAGAMFLENDFLVECNDCNPEEFRVKSFFGDPDRPNVQASVIFRLINPTTIKIKIYLEGAAVVLSPADINQPQKPQVPLGEYIMTKQ